jgi:tRNA nucleotidyltransferase (CCA-adding enzyme)
MNGLADLGNKELRALSATALYDDPSRLLRLVRLKLRLGYAVDERTQSQYENARAAGMENQIPRRLLCEELKHISTEPNPSEVVRALNEDGLLRLFSPSLAGAKLNIPGLVKLEKVRRLVPNEATNLAANWGPFLLVLTEKLNTKEKQALVKQTEMRKAEVDLWQKLPARAKKLESALKSPKLKKASQIYDLLTKSTPDDILYLLYHSPARLIQDRIRNYLQKYVPLSQEITDAEVEAKGVAPGTPKFQKLKEEMIVARLDGRTKKPPPAPVEPPAPVTAMQRGRGVR